MLLLSETDVRHLLSMDDLIESMESALAEFSSGRTLQPLRTVLEVGPEPRVLRRHAGVHAGEWCARHQARHGIRQQRRPSACPRTSRRSCCWTRRRVSCCRSWTDATSPRREPPRCRPSRRGSSRVRMPGCWRFSAQACRRAATCGRSATCARCGTSASGVRARRTGAPLPRRCIARSPHPFPPSRASVKPSTAPIWSSWRPRRASRSSQSEWIADGAHISAVGACRPDHREMDTALVKRARVFVDSRTGALAEAVIWCCRFGRARSMRPHRG